MAEDRYDPEVAKNRRFILFAEELVNDVMNQDKHVLIFEDQELPFREFSHNHYDQSVQSAVTLLNKSSEMNNDYAFSQLKTNFGVYTKTYMEFVKKITLQYFSKGYNPESFLKFCVSISNMAALFYTSKLTCAPRLAKDYITETLTKYHMTDERWNDLKRIAADIGNMSRPSKRKHEISSEEENDTNCS